MQEVPLMLWPPVAITANNNIPTYLFLIALSKVPRFYIVDNQKKAPVTADNTRQIS